MKQFYLFYSEQNLHQVGAEFNENCHQLGDEFEKELGGMK